MSINKSTFEQIAKNPLNTSKSKSLYSFSKQKRFMDNNKKLCDKFYNLPNFKSDRYAGLGYGNKYDFTKGVYKTPGPGKYEYQSEFQTSKSKIGIAIGESRDKMEIFGIFNNPTKQFPGPGNYKQKSQLSGSQYSFRPRTKDPNTFSTAIKNPGPGAYPYYSTIKKDGQYHFSKYENSKAAAFHPPHSERFPRNQYQNKNPAPGFYDQKVTMMNQTGSYHLSNMQNSRVRSFSHQNKDNGLGGIYENCKESSKIPGPGSYQLPSDFGHYESKSFHQNSQQQGQSKVSNN